MLCIVSYMYLFVILGTTTPDDSCTKIVPINFERGITTNMFLLILRFEKLHLISFVTNIIPIAITRIKTDRIVSHHDRINPPAPRGSFYSVISRQ